MKQLQSTKNLFKLMEIKTLLRPIDWLDGISHGYACGYVGVPPEHPWYGKTYFGDNQLPDIEVHRGVTWANPYIGADTTYMNDGKTWWIGFDTAHDCDTMENCNRAYCETQLASLKQQAFDALNAYTP